MITLTGIISALSFYLIPIFIGRGAYVISNKGKNLPYPYVTYFIWGVLTIFIWAMIDRYILLLFLPQYSFISLYRFILIGLTGLSIVANLVTLHQHTDDYRLGKYIIPFFSSLFVSVLVFYIWNIRSPYPLNWDFLEHQTLVNNILEGRFSFFTTKISDTFVFDGYSSIFHTLLASSQLFINPGTLDFWSCLSLLHIFMVTLASYLLGYEVTRNENISLISAIFGAFIFETVSLTSLFFIPQTFTAVVFIFLFIQMIKTIKSDKPVPLNITFLSSILLFLNHYVMGTLAVICYLLVYIFIRFGKRIAPKLQSVSLVETGILSAIILIILSTLLPLDFINQGEAKFYNFTLIEKIIFFLRSYGYSLIIFLPLGIIQILKRKRAAEMIILIIALLLFSLVLVQIPYSLKFYVLSRFFIHFIMSIGVYALIRQIKTTFLQNLAFIIFIISISVVFILNAVYWKNILNYKNILTHISPNEIEAAEFLKTNYKDKNILLISDPATQNILETFSGVNTPGGAYSTVKTRQLLSTISKASSSSQFKDNINQIQDNLSSGTSRRLLVLSGRYFLWQLAKPKDKEAFYYNIWTPADLTLENQKYIRLLLSGNDYFKQVYQNPTMVIIEVAI